MCSPMLNVTLTQPDTTTCTTTAPNTHAIDKAHNMHVYLLTGTLLTDTLLKALSQHRYVPRQYVRLAGDPHAPFRLYLAMSALTRCCS
jgi:hypothetical protein